MNIRLCYRIDKEAKLAKDESGNYAETYSCAKIDCNSYNIPKEKYKELIDIGKRLTASGFNIDENLITPITLNEYLDNVEDEENGEDM